MFMLVSLTFYEYLDNLWFYVSIYDLLRKVILIIIIIIFDL